MTERLRFLTDVRRHIASFTELCARYAVSRKTGYKWLHRAERDGTATLAEASRRPHRSPSATPAAIVAAVVAARHRHPTWGPRKLLKLLQRRTPRQAWPARSTVADLLRRHGLVEPRRRRRYPGHPGRPLTPMTAPNGIWTADFKGQFKTGDGIYCYPLTVQDGFSRYLLACRGLSGTTYAESRPVFERLFREYGLPQMLRTDNGVPFATGALGRLSQLSVWWVRLGIVPELIEPGRPQQKRPPRTHAPNAQAGHCTAAGGQSRATTALLRCLPARVQRAATARSAGRCHARVDLSTLVATVPRAAAAARVSGALRSPAREPQWWHSLAQQWVNVSHVLGEQSVGFTEVDDGEWDLYFGPLRLGRFHERTLTIEDALGRLARRRVLPMSLD